ncbi:hypothetical protein Y695_04637 [Hydrogenophaga sp. T4]|nr:hypothetical protein Y695_04637 [Hydrogenophaga sp. T4]
MTERTRIGAISAVMPRISAMLTMLEPQALPSASPGLPCEAASTDTTISGAEVPKPTISMPTSSGGTAKCWAVAEAPATKRSALHTSSNSPARMASDGSSMASRVGVVGQCLGLCQLTPDPPSCRT